MQFFDTSFYELYGFDTSFLTVLLIYSHVYYIQAGVLLSLCGLVLMRE